MAAPVLLVHDDIATIASVRRLLARDGYEVILATSAADAIIAFGHYLPGLIILAPGVEGGRGYVVLEELALHPDRQLSRVLLLGESIPGFAAPVVPLPLDGKLFLDTVQQVMRDPGTDADAWTVIDHRRAPEALPAIASESDDWRATAPPTPTTGGLEESALFGDLPKLNEADWELAAMDPDERQRLEDARTREQLADAAAQRAIEATHREVEQEALATLESALTQEHEVTQVADVHAEWAQPPPDLDGQLEDFEREVLEAARERRRQREARNALAQAQQEVAQEIGALEPEAELATREAEARSAEAEDALPADEERERARLAAELEAARIAAQEEERRLAAETEAAEASRLAAEEEFARLEELRRASEEAARLAEEKRLAEAREAEEQRLAAEREAQELARVAEERRLEAEREAQELARVADERRLEAEREARELARIAEERRLAAEREAEEALRAAEERRAAEVREAEELARLQAEEALRIAEAQREAAEREAEEARRLAAEASRRIAEELRLAAEAEAARREEAARLEAEARARAEREALEAEYQARLQEAEERAQRELQAEVEARAQREAELQAQVEERARREAELQAQVEEVGSRLSAAEQALAESESALAEAIARESALVEREREAARLAEEAQYAAQLTREQTELRAEELRQQSDAAIAQLHAEIEKSSELARLEREERETLAAKLSALDEERERAERRAEEAMRAAEAERLQLEEEQRAREAAEAEAARAREEAEALAAHAARPLELPAAKPLRLVPSGTVSTEELANLIARLSEAKAEVRIDLRVTDALRTLWLQRGLFVGAISSLPHESLIDRARRDGLIDHRQDTELRLLRGMSPAELLARLRQRGYLREQEVVPLVQRYTEHLTLEALSEPSSEYRISDDPLPPGVPVAALPRAPIALVIEALKRGVDGVDRLGALGGLGAIPALREDANIDPQAAGLNERERRLLAHVDGETTIEELLLAAGMRQEPALKLLTAAQALGWIELRPAEVEKEVAPAPELELARLDAKFREVQEADYFSILGLPRTAGEEEIHRAFAQLSAEFDPLRFIGHPDTAVQHQARQVQEALSEAAQVLANDRLRASYARSLVD